MNKETHSIIFKALAVVQIIISVLLFLAYAADRKSADPERRPKPWQFAIPILSLCSGILRLTEQDASFTDALEQLAD